MRECEREWPSITNVGYNRPTFNGHRLTSKRICYPRCTEHHRAAIAVEFLRWVREERKFESPEALKSQILRDVERAQIYFRRLGEMTASAR